MDEQIIDTASGLGDLDLVEGTGARPKTGDSVSVHYTGWLRSGQPAHLAYGDRGAGGVIPPGATLIFEVELVAINEP